MSDFSWMGLLNKLLNLAVLVGVCGYLFKKHAFPAIKGALDSRKRLLSDLKKEVSDLQEKTDALSQQTAQAQARATFLLGRIEEWKKALQQQQYDRSQDAQKTEQASRAYLQKRAEGLCQEYMKRDLVREIVERTEQEVRTFFADKKNQNQYITQHLKLLSQRKSRG